MRFSSSLKKMLWMMLWGTSTICIADNAKVGSLPRLVYWIWPQAQDLRFLDPKQEAVAQLVATIALTSTGVSTTVYHPICRLPEHIRKIAVIHLTIANRLHPKLSKENAKRIAKSIQKVFQPGKYIGLQIDFSATRQQREFYTILLNEIRNILGESINISITALASWCVGEAWIAKAKLPIDYVVPMYFSLAQTEQAKRNFTAYFPKKFTFLAEECQQAIGLSTQESWHFPLRAKVSVFVYHPHAWQQKDIFQARKLAEEIH